MADSRDSPDRAALQAFREEQHERALAALREFYAADIHELLNRRARTNPQSYVLALLRSVNEQVPAYRAFLERCGVDPRQVRTLADFAQIPATTKDNYQRVSPLAALCKGGRLESCDMLAVSSGSTGTPAFWPRFVSDELGTTLRFEQVLHDSFRADERRTLAVICFALGNWVGGMYTTAACRHLATKGYPLTIATPGNNIAEILRVVQGLASAYDQVVLFGYPPFLKDVIDRGRAAGHDWSAPPTRLVMAGEVFSEEWRSLVCERLGASDPPHDTASLYGTADGGVIANETALSIVIRQFLAQNPKAAQELFGEARLPTLCQYDPLHRYFELDGDELVFTGDGGAPLIRYKILDRGGLVPYERMLAFLGQHGFDPLSALSEAARERARTLPFVFVFGRSNFAVSFYGANVFPENVSVGLEQPEFASLVSGKFVMQVTHDEAQNAFLEIVVELAAGAKVTSELEATLARSIQHHVERLNSEFKNYVPAERRLPNVSFRANGNPEYFPLGVKHRYTR